jgi:hypothetical protein
MQTLRHTFKNIYAAQGQNKQVEPKRHRDDLTGIIIPVKKSLLVIPVGGRKNINMVQP